MVPVTVTSISKAQSSGVLSRKGLSWVAAALLTRISMGPRPVSTASTAAFTSSSLRRSAPTAMALTPTALASSTASSAPADEA
jgi:hypothetical protein